MTDIDDHCRAAKAHIEKGDKAKDRADQHYNSASQHIAAIHELTPDKAVFLEIVKLRIGIGKSRTYEMLAIGQGKKTNEEVQAATTERWREFKAREQEPCPLANGQAEDDDERCASLPAEMLVDGRPATEKQRADFVEMLERTEDGLSAPCSRAMTWENPIIAAWRDAEDPFRANFVRVYRDDLLRLMRETEHAGAAAA